MNVTPEIQFILNTFSFLVSGVLVMWMAAGFAMLEAGMVRTKNVSTILLKNVALFSIAAVMYLLAGYNLMYTGVDGGYIGTLGLWSPNDSLDALKAGQYASSSDWFFQMVFVATAASIVSGAVAERVKLWSFFIFTAILTAVIYPIVGAWTWGGGWLSEMGFSDFAGSTIVHSVGGWAALVGVILIGPRIGKYTRKESMTTEEYEKISAGWKHNPMPASNLPLATLGTFILWMGWFGFNGGSVLSLGTAADAATMANVFLNTAVAAAGGVIASLLLSAISYKKVDITLVLNGALAGLVAITAGPDTPLPWEAVLIGAVGGAIACYAIPLLDKMHIDDVVGAIPVHLIAGIWGTMAVPITNHGTSFATQAIGVAAVGVFVVTSCILVWGLLRITIGVRAPGHVEEAGLDKHDIGIDAYPEWTHAQLTDYKQHVI